MRLLFIAPLALSLAAVSICPSVFAAPPSPGNRLSEILEKSCLDGNCVEGYRVRFRKLSFEPNRQEATAWVTLTPDQGIDYPILSENFEAQLTQESFAGICKIRHVPSLEAIQGGGAGDETVGNGEALIAAEFSATLKSCLRALTERTEKALGRSL